MDIIYWGNFILIPIALLELILGIYILSRKPRSAVSVSFAIFCFAVALWVFASGYGPITSSESQRWFWLNSTFFSASIIVSILLFFSWVFPYRSKEIKLKEYIYLIFPVLFFTILLIFTNTLVKGIDYSGKYLFLTFGFFWHVFAVYFVLFWLWAFINLYLKYRKSDGIHRWQLKYLLIGIVLSSVFGMATNLLLPWIFGVNTSSFIYIGPGSSVIWLGMVSYIIFKR